MLGEWSWSALPNAVADANSPRLVRLHRPFLSRGYDPTSAFHYSTQQCVSSARSIINSNYELLSITTSHWWSESRRRRAWSLADLPFSAVYTSSMRAAIVLFMDLFHQIDEDVSHAEVNEVSRREWLSEPR